VEVAPAADPWLCGGRNRYQPIHAGQNHDPKTFQVIAEVGVVFLMFSIGLEFSWEGLAGVKWIALIGGPLGIALSALLVPASAGCLAGTS
jgi:Kef-type K+ transport system membrane component KefB